jgi:hypothetical protein
VVLRRRNRPATANVNFDAPPLTDTVHTLERLQSRWRYKAVRYRFERFDGNSTSIGLYPLTFSETECENVSA